MVKWLRGRDDQD